MDVIRRDFRTGNLSSFGFSTDIPVLLTALVLGIKLEDPLLQRKTDMRRKITLSIALSLSMLVSLAGFASTTQAQSSGKRAIARSGVIRLGPGQILRIVVNGQDGNDTLTVRFRRTYYVGSANGGIWKTTNIAAQDTSAPITLAANEAASIDASQTGFDAVSIEVLIRGFSGTTTIQEGRLQIINPDGSVATCFETEWQPTL
jgi:hypothetical protein